jgi:polysaccharide deacetylase family protein (PEP-CTERM system associated)
MPTTALQAEHGNDAVRLEPQVGPAAKVPVVLSFDVEEHFLIENAAGLTVAAELKSHYQERLDVMTRWLLDSLAAHEVRATFFVLGQAAQQNPALIRAIHQAGHELASHGWSHSRLHLLTPALFREEIKKSKALLEGLTGAAVVGFRAPTFSLDHSTSWAIDVLVEEGFCYDSSIYPIYHDRYGIPRAPRMPFVLSGSGPSILELPPLTYRFLGLNVPVGGGGYFRLLPTWLIHKGIGQMRKCNGSALALLYFHPWEFDTEQVRLPIGRLNRFRTYVGIKSGKQRLATLLKQLHCVRALDAVKLLQGQAATLEQFSLQK